MKINKKTIDLLHEFESCRLEAYLCPAKIPTIGWGNTYYEDGSKVKLGNKITQERADSLFIVILNEKADLLRKKLGSRILTENQFGALLSFLYNVGPGLQSVKDGLFVLKNGKPSTLWRLVQHNPDDPLIANQFRLWINKGSSFEKGLKRRREAEIELYYSK